MDAMTQAKLKIALNALNSTRIKKHYDLVVDEKLKKITLVPKHKSYVEIDRPEEITDRSEILDI